MRRTQLSNLYELGIIIVRSNRLQPFRDKKTGKQMNTAMIENINPPIVPMAKENQKTSFSPSNKNGIKPKQVERIVNIIG